MKMKVGSILIGAILACALLVAGCSSEQGRKKPPNIILISIDTLRADHLSLHGYERKTSPFIDSLARKYTYFTRAYSQGTWTLPSHWSILTGQYPSQAGIFEGGKYYMKHGFDARPLTTLPELLTPHYRSYACVNGGWMHSAFGYDKGFQEYYSTGGAILPEKTKEIWDVINKSAEPYFLFLHTFYVHDYRPNWKKHDPLYRDPAYSGYFKSLGKFKESEHLWEPLRAYPPKVKLSDADINFLIDIYDEAIREFDGLLEDFLRPYMARIEDGRLVVIITSDHGEAFGEERKNGYIVDHHGVPYDEQCRVPLIITVPGGRRDHLVGAGIDIAPTILDLAGIDIPPAIQGKSLLGQASERAIVTEALHAGNSFAMRSDRTYIMNHDETEIYASSDMQQTENLLTRPESAGRPISKERREELRALGYVQ